MKPFKAFRIHSEGGKIAARFEDLTLDDLAAGEVVIRVACSDINYKDALAATGAGAISGSSLNLRMKRRSIQSLRRHTQCPAKLTPLRAPTAYLSPVVMR